MSLESRKTYLIYKEMMGENPPCIYRDCKKEAYLYEMYCSEHTRVTICDLT